MSLDANVWCVVLLVAFWPATKATSVKVEQIPPILNVSIGGNGSMHCKFPLLQGTAEVFWWKEGQKAYIEPDSRNQFNVQKVRGTFTLLNVRHADIGRYYCRVRIQQQILGNGNGSQLIVLAPPTPLKIIRVEEASSKPRKLVCKTAAFYPKNIDIIWRRNDMEILTNIVTSIIESSEGFYEASSTLEDAQPAQGKVVYTCLVSHETLTIPASFSYIIEQGADNKLIPACAVGGSVILILIIVLLILKLKTSHGGNTNSLDGDQNEDPAQQAPVNQATTYASLNHRERKPFRKDQQQEERAIYSQPKGNEADKMTYAALQFPDSNIIQASKHQSKHTLYADVNTSKRL